MQPQPEAQFIIVHFKYMYVKLNECSPENGINLEHYISHTRKGLYMSLWHAPSWKAITVTNTTPQTITRVNRKSILIKALILSRVWETKGFKVIPLIALIGSILRFTALEPEDKKEFFIKRSLEVSFKQQLQQDDMCFQTVIWVELHAAGRNHFVYRLADCPACL